MIRKQVQSSDITSVGYDENSNTLEIEFHGGQVYDYINVPIHIYSGLMSAYSKGRFFNDHIKERFRFLKKV